ncbi:hypothetical protein GA0115240_171113 [Streptomyces sp. DvalAA-14]|nr:hypothetical protein GA0115240_171113 [Streptomyces sp. DvalAA-14]
MVGGRVGSRIARTEQPGNQQDLARIVHCPLGRRHGASAADIAWSSPLLRTVSIRSTAPAWDTTARPPPSTRTRGQDPMRFLT